MGKTREFGCRFSIPRQLVGERYELLLEDPDIEAIYIPLPSGLHAEIAGAALLAGKHVLCEKPLALNVGDARRLIETQTAAGRVFVEDFSYQFTPGYQFVRELLNSKCCGTVHAIQVVLTFNAGQEHAIRFNRQLGGGCLYDLTCYGVDLAHRLFGLRPGEAVVKAIPLCTKLAKLGNGSLVEGRVWSLLETLDGSELSIYTAFEGSRQDVLTLVGEAGSCFLPAFFLPDEKGTAAFLQTGTTRWVHELPGVDQNSIQIQRLCARVAEEKILDVDDHQRWIWNASILEELHRKVDTDLTGS